MKSDKKRKKAQQPVAQIQRAFALEEKFKKLKETETFELKKSTSELKEGIISIVSILNKHQRGELYFTATPQATPQVTPQGILTGLESKVLAEVIKDPRISRSRISKKLGIGPDTVKEYLGKLKKKGILERKGETSGGYWKIIGK